MIENGYLKRACVRVCVCAWLAFTKYCIGWTRESKRQKISFYVSPWGYFFVKLGMMDGWMDESWGNIFFRV